MNFPSSSRPGWIALLAGTLTLAGCGKSSSDAPAPADTATSVERTAAVTPAPAPVAADEALDLDDPFVAAARSKFLGRFEAADQQASLHLKPKGVLMAGPLVFKGQTYEVQTTLKRDGVTGQFGIGDEHWPLALESDGTRLTLRSGPGAIELIRRPMLLAPGIYSTPGGVWLVIKGAIGERTGLLRFQGREFPFTGRIVADEFVATGENVAFELVDTADPAVYQFRNGAFRETVHAITGRAVLDDPTLPAAYADEAELKARAAEREAARIAAAAAERAAAEQREAEAAADAAERVRLAEAEVLVQRWGERRTVPDLNLTMIAVRPGTFDMGSTDFDSDERPVTRVTLTRAYWLGRTEVTNRQWEIIMGEATSDYYAQRPKSSVPHHQALEFCRKLTQREADAGRLPEGYVYTLPTEAQWEYACRAGTTGAYAGDLDAMGWYDDNDGSVHDVAQKTPNAWGFYDMHGNIAEWCLDRKGPYAGGKVTDPTGHAANAGRVVRGGCFFWNATSCRSSYRQSFEGKDVGNALGFRLCLSAAN